MIFSFKNRQTPDSYNPELWCAAYIVSCSDGDLNILDVG
jgi:hypothetical protein